MYIYVNIYMKSTVYSQNKYLIFLYCVNLSTDRCFHYLFKFRNTSYTSMANAHGLYGLFGKCNLLIYYFDFKFPFWIWNYKYNVKIKIVN